MIAALGPGDPAEPERSDFVLTAWRDELEGWIDLSALEPEQAQRVVDLLAVGSLMTHVALALAADLVKQLEQLTGERTGQDLLALLDQIEAAMPVVSDEDKA